MATSTLVQSLSQDGTVSNRRQTETFIANEVFAAADIGTIAMVDGTQTGSDQLLKVKKATAVALGNGRAVGVVLNAAAVGERVELVVAGHASTVRSAGSISAGTVVTACPAGQAGKILAAVAADVARPFGVVLTTGTSPECWIYPQF